MAEVGAASAIIGVASFGVQVAQGLLQYYGSWKDQDGIVSEMRASLASLSKTLTTLKETVERRGQSNPSAQIGTNVMENVNRVEEVMKNLGGELKKVQDTKEPQPGKRSALRRRIRRALYPFNEKTLEKIQQAVSEARSELILALHVLQIEGISDVVDIRPDVKSLVRWKEDDDTRRILIWLSPVNFWLKQQDVRRQRTPGTGRWILDHPRFLDWENGNRDMVWCLGSRNLCYTHVTLTCHLSGLLTLAAKRPASARQCLRELCEPFYNKTKPLRINKEVRSAVIDFLEGDLPNPPIGLAFLYCNHKENIVQSVEYFLGAVVRQLIERKRAIPKAVHSLYEKHRGKETASTCEDYMDLLRSLAAEHDELYIVIDALDECVDKDGRFFWSGLFSKLKSSIVNLRLLCTSRHMEDVGGTLSSSIRIEIRARDEDIRAYVRAQIEASTALFQLCEEETNVQDEIAQAILLKSEGIFLAAQLYVEFLADMNHLRAVKKALKALPSTLDGNYEEAMQRIKRQPKPTKLLALKALSWVVYAVRSLHLEELRHAIAVDELEEEDRSVTKDCLAPPSRIVNVCAGLIRIDTESNVVGLVHKTTQEYFNTHGRNHFPRAQRDIGMTCFRYLSLDVFSDGYCSSDESFERRLKENALLEYAARSLGDHIPTEIMDDYNIADLVLNLFLDERKISCISQALFVIARNSWLPGYSQIFPKNFQGLHYAAYLGLRDITKQLLGTGKVDPDSKDKYGRTPLSRAAERGHEAVVKQLLSTGKVDPDSKDHKYGRTPLFWAVKEGHEAVVKQLLDTGKVDPDSKDKYVRQPFFLAAARGHGRTPLSWAAKKGYEAVVKQLLDTGKVDLDSKDDKYRRTPLSWAAEPGNEAIVKQLLDTGKVDLNAQDKYGRTPLSWAAANGHEAVVKLLTKKVDADSKNESGQTPLTYTAANGYEAVVKLFQSKSPL